jgi:hypothetical protein
VYDTDGADEMVSSAIDFRVKNDCREDGARVSTRLTRRR